MVVPREIVNELKVIRAMMVPHISVVFVPVSATVGDLDGLGTASMDEESCKIGPDGRYAVAGLLVPVGELEQRGIPELVAQPAAMMIGLSTHEHAILVPHQGGMWKLLLHSGKGIPETYTFRDRPEPRPVASVTRRRQFTW